MLCANSPQEVMDLGAVAHLSAIKGKVPFLHFFDGFRTSHEVQKIEVWDYEDLGEMLDWDAVNAFRRNALNPEHPVLRGQAQNGDIFFQAREACNKYYDAVPEVVVDYMNQVNAKIGTDYKPFNYYGAPDAEKVIIAMGSACETMEEVIDYLTAAGEKVGLIKVRLYRPLCGKIPPGRDAQNCEEDLRARPYQGAWLHRRAPVSGCAGRYQRHRVWLLPRIFRPLWSGLQGHQAQRHHCRVPQHGSGRAQEALYHRHCGRRTHLSLDAKEDPDTAPAGTTSCKFWGLGSDGTVGANKNSIKIIGDHTDMYAQGYFDYDSKKSGGLTISHLRLAIPPSNPPIISARPTSLPAIIRLISISTTWCRI